MTLRHWREEFYAWERCVYRRLFQEDLSAKVYEFLNRADMPDKEGENWRPLRVTRNMVAEVVGQMRALCHAYIEMMPAWLDRLGRPDPRDVVAFQDKILDVSKFVADPQYVPHPASPHWFSESVLPCGLNPSATCPRWLDFLNQVLEGVDREGNANPKGQQLISLLQEWFGYCLSGDTSMQKMLWLHGRSGAGKSTVARMLQHVVGERNSVSFSLWDLTETFTLSSFLGKTLAVSQDAHLGRGTDGQRVIEQIKAITGEDDRLINRKNRELLAGVRLKVRFVISVNQFPSLPDAGDTLRRRSLILPFERSFRGQEDTQLGAKLATETPGVVVWALEGLRRLRAAGRFSETDKGKELQNRFSRLLSPIQEFVEECCVLPEKHCNPEELPWVVKRTLFTKYVAWAKVNGLRNQLTQSQFGEQIFALPVEPPIRDYKPRDGDKRATAYRGIGLLPDESDDQQQETFQYQTEEVPQEADLPW